ncbi:MAG: cellulase family glycosylhydrolase [Bacteroidota bacterium]
MLKPIIKLFFVLSILGVLGTLSAQITPAEAVAAMGRGINLGNTLEPPLEGDWNNGPAQASYFDNYVDAGFTNVRIPVRWDQHTANSAPFNIDSDWMDRVEEVVDWGLERGLYITLNGHHEDWLKQNYSNPTLRARYDAIWEQVSERFQDKSERLLFEIINEPNGMTVAEVDDLNLRILGIIRATNPTRIVIYGGNMYSNSEQLLTAGIPNDDYIIGYFHSYDPWPFAGQGNGSWGTPQDYQALNDKFAAVGSWSTANGIPVHLSEFGAVHECDYNSRMRHYAAYVEAALENGFAFSVWDDGGMFGVLNRNAGTWPEVKDILIYTYSDSPDQVEAIVLQDDPDNPQVQLQWRNRATDNDSIRVQRQVGSGAFIETSRLAPNAASYLDADVEAGQSYTYRLVTFRADGTELQSYPSRAVINNGGQGEGIINYFDGLESGPGLFSGNPAGITFDVSEGMLTITGDGTAPPWQVFQYTLPNSTFANVVGSNNRLYIRARTRSGNPANLRIDLVDENNYHTTLGSVSQSITGTDFQEYLYSYVGSYQDGAFGGTGCSTGPCSVNGSRIVGMTFYPEPPTGGFNDIIDIEYLSFGQPLVSTREFVELDALQIYPNPASDLIELAYELPTSARVGVKLFTTTGQLVRHQFYGEQPGGRQQIQLPVEGLAAGHYSLQLLVDGKYTRGFNVQLY